MAQLVEQGSASERSPIRPCQGRSLIAGLVPAGACGRGNQPSFSHISTFLSSLSSSLPLSLKKNKWMRKTHQVWRGEGGDKAEKPLNLTWAWQGQGDEKRQEPRHSRVKILTCTSGSSYCCSSCSISLDTLWAHWEGKCPYFSALPTLFHSLSLPDIPKGSPQSRGQQATPNHQRTVEYWSMAPPAGGAGNWSWQNMRRELGIIFEKSDPYMAEKITTGWLNI